MIEFIPDGFGWAVKESSPHASEPQNTSFVGSSAPCGDLSTEAGIPATEVNQELTYVGFIPDGFAWVRAE